MEHLNDESVQTFTDRFFGYGDFGAPFWFVGMEEGGGNSLSEVHRRIETWRGRGASPLEDLVEYHYALGITDHLGARPKLQPTWSKLVHLLLATENIEPSDTAVREYQSTRLGRRGGMSALIELLPLPSPNVQTWIYRSATTFPWLSTRDAYRRHLITPRIEAIRARIATHRPRAVVFLGLSYAPYWSRIAGVPLTPSADTSFDLKRTEDGTYAIVKHPTARGVTNELYRALGRTLSS